jgi:hypothetical protein
LIFSAFSLLPTIMGLLGLQPSGVSVSRLTIRDEVILKVPVVRPRRMDWPVRWVEKKGPKCIRSDSVVAAALHDESSIDFLLRDRRRVRAQMGAECPTLDFYGGFYLTPEKGQICARRDEIRNRMGGSCQIERFRVMVPTAPK